MVSSAGNSGDHVYKTTTTTGGGSGVIVDGVDRRTTGLCPETGEGSLEPMDGMN